MNLSIQRENLIRNIINTINDEYFNNEIENGDNLVNQLFEDEVSSNTPTDENFRNTLEEITIDQSFLDQEHSCAICMDNFQLGETCIKLPCDDQPHYFHSGRNQDICSGIKPWLKTNNSCPVCRHEFPSQNIQINHPDNIPDTIPIPDNIPIPEQNIPQNINEGNIDLIVNTMMNNIRSNLHNTINNIPDNLLIIGTGQPVLQPVSDILNEQENINPPIPDLEPPAPDLPDLEPPAPDLPAPDLPAPGLPLQENINSPIPAPEIPVPEQENIDPSRDNISVLISRVNRINRLHRLQRLQRANEIRMREQALREEEERQIQQAIELSFHN
jgi:hypothetical protein